MARSLGYAARRARALVPPHRSHALAMNFLDVAARTRVSQRLFRTLGDQETYAGGRPGQPSHQGQQAQGILAGNKDASRSTRQVQGIAVAISSANTT